MGSIRWLGHAAFEVVLDGVRVLIDPWIRGNPACPASLSEISECDLVLVTHDHGDHLGDAYEVAKRTGATLVAIYELAQEASRRGVPSAVGMNVGGTVEVKGLRVLMVPAHHSSSLGQPVGFFVMGREGTVYHAGDTGIVHDVALYAELHPVDVALVPIGSVYTMGPEEAAYFVSLIKPKVAVPMHYNTFPAIKQDPKVFERLVKKRAPGVRVVVLRPGQSWEF